VPRFEIPLCGLLLISLVVACRVDNKSIHTPGASATVGISAKTTPTALIVRTPKSAPAGLLPDARPVAQTATLGQLTRLAGGTPRPVDLRRLLDAFCQNGLMTIRTSKETVYAALSCDRFLDDRTKPQFLGKDAAITLEVSADRYRVLIETLDGAQGEFTVDGIWLK
jgi:hypothetical protein